MNKTKRVQVTNESLESRDGKSILRIVRNTSDVKSVKKTNQIGRTPTGKQIFKPTLVVGFPGAGLVGSISASYVIEKMQLRQIAFIDSDYVVPTVIYTGGILRHPFRIYSNDDATLFVMICEAPVMTHGINSIMDLVATWVVCKNIGEVIVLDGMPVRGFPSSERKPEVFRNYLVHPSGNNSSNNSSAEETELPEPRTAVVTGLSAGVLEACISFDIPCTGVLISATSGVPDPEAAAILLEFVSAMPHVPIEIDVEPLKKEGSKIKKQLSTFIGELRGQGQADAAQERHEPSSYLGGSTIYG